jgi:diaminopimelate epimerase
LTPTGRIAVPFEKWDATGNDFVLVDLQHSPLSASEISPDLVRAMCRRDSGVGADGVVLLSQPEGEPCEVTIWNSDGSLGAMCGNALRCVAMVLARQSGPPERPVRIGQRLVHTRLEGEGRSSVSMGPAAAVDGFPEYEQLDELDALLGGRGHLLSFGNPHYVVPFERIPQDWAERGARAQAPAQRLLGLGGINCGFLQVRPEDGIHPLRVLERGVGVTRSCGSGACAASAVLQNRLGVAPPHRLGLPGGVLEIGREPQGGYRMAGAACMEFTGAWSIE